MNATTRRPVAGLWKRALGLLYIYWWIARARVRSAIERTSILILLLYLVWTFLEVALELYGAWAGTHAYWLLRATFYLLIGIALYTKVREWSEHRQELYFIQAAQKITALLSQARRPDEPAPLETVMAIALGAFSRKGGIRATLACQTDEREEVLKVIATVPFGAVIDESRRFKKREGGSGWAWSEQCVVYIPRRRIGHAVVQELTAVDPYFMVEDLFVPDKVQDFECVLSVPLIVDGNCYGALNFDSRKCNAFRRIDFQQAMFFGLALAHILQNKKR